MPRKLIVCCDGTGNEFGKKNTNVARIVRSLADVDGSQLLYYDPGIGTFAEPSLSARVGTRTAELLDLAFAIGLEGKVQEAYTYLMDTWELGDDVFLFGFSRGAYTVRVLAALLHQIGLLHPHSSNLLPYAMRLFDSLRTTGAKEKYQSLCDDFRRAFARDAGDPTERRFRIRFMGLWDTVSSVGRVWEPKSFPFTASNPSVGTVRHAVSLDERRCFFRQNLLTQANGQDLWEVWFPGVHSDVGGGYPEADGGIWRPSFQWVADEAAQAGLRYDDARVAAVLGAGPPATARWLERVHESLTPGWWPAEFYPKLVYNRKTEQRRPQCGFGRSRILRPKAVLHATLAERILNNSSYVPPNLTTVFKNALAGAPTERNIIYDPAGTAVPEVR